MQPLFSLPLSDLNASGPSSTVSDHGRVWSPCVLSAAMSATCAKDHDDGESPEVGVGSETRVIEHAAERRLCLKFDVRILPVLATMCE